jgi:hypothetical protein
MRALVRAHATGAVLLDPHAAEEAASGAPLAVRSRVVLRVRPQRRSLVAHERAVALPLREQLAGRRVTVRLALRQVDRDDVPRRASEQLGALRLIDHVVRRRDDVRERPGDSRFVVQRAQRLDIGHRLAPTLAAREAGAPTLFLVRTYVRMTHYEQALRSYDDLVAQPTFRDFVCVYIADGYKRDRRRVALASADPDVIRLAHRWIWQLSERSPSSSVRYAPDQSREELRRFWSGVVGERPQTIRTRRASAEELQHASSARPVHGVMTLAVHDRVLRARMQAWMRRTREAWA